MEIQFFMVISYLLAASYLVWRASGSAMRAWHAGRAWWLKRSLSNRLAIADRLYGHASRSSFFISMIGLAVGIGVVLFLFQRLQRADWLLLALVVAGFGLEKFRPSRQQIVLPDVITLISIYRASTARGYELFDALRFASSKLPQGLMKDAVEEALQRRRCGMSLEKCLAPLKICNQHLAEFVTQFEVGGWKPIGTADHIALLHRAKWEWNLNSQTYLFIERVQRYLKPLRSFALGGLIAALWFNALPFHGSLAMIWSEWFI